MSTLSIEERPTIEVRDLQFAFEELQEVNFFKGNPMLTAFIAALSASFPSGEGEFIASVKNFATRVDDLELQEQIREFIGQEGQHSKHHRHVNQAIAALGWNMEGCERFFKKTVERQRNEYSDKKRLALTACFEHQTAIMATYMLTHPEAFAGGHPEVVRLLQWHSIEEIEHKAVAFDVYMAIFGDRKFLHKQQTYATFRFQRNLLWNQVKLLWWRKTLPRPKHIVEYLRFFFGKNGMARVIHPLFKDFYRDDFHPWDHHNQALVDEWKEKLNLQRDA